MMSAEISRLRRICGISRRFLKPAVPKEIGMLFKQGKAEEANSAKAKTAELKEAIKIKDQEFAAIDKELEKLDLNQLTPIEALNTLAALQAKRKM